MTFRGVTITAETGHTMQEWEELEDKYDVWSFLIGDFADGAVEPDPDILYWYIDGRLCETPTEGAEEYEEGI